MQSWATLASSPLCGRWVLMSPYCDLPFGAQFRLTVWFFGRSGLSQGCDPGCQTGWACALFIVVENQGWRPYVQAVQVPPGRSFGCPLEKRPLGLMDQFASSWGFPKRAAAPLALKLLAKQESHAGSLQDGGFSIERKGIKSMRALWPWLSVL